ncbi:type VI secretion system Vgr family protein [Aquimarina agarivorans]|uniref:type VI secretion system Vgr family protein n=1 Tax=Aquimarina agarivorans TaxID=980584 RepID=UPI000248EB47|nr:phage baseplate assembly protein V [Aquimarina agarivorans]
MAQHTKIQVTIDGTEIPLVENFALNEKVGEHASFNFSTEGTHYDENDIAKGFLENTKEFIGKPCSIRLLNIEEGVEKELYFKGIVTNLQSIRRSQNGNFREGILISGKSTSILLEDGLQFKSFSESTISDIILKATENVPATDFKKEINLQNDIELKYSVQNNQSTFQFLKRLAANYSEFLLYSKETLYFGKPNFGNPISLELNGNLSNVNFGLHTAPGNFTFLSNDYLNEQTQQAASSDISTPNEMYINTVNQNSASLYPSNNNLYYNTFDDSGLNNRISKAMEVQKKLADQNLVSLSGTCFYLGLGLGNEINITGSDNNLGSYRIVAINHNYNQSGSYSNSFTAIPVATDVYPLTNVNSFIHSETQIAKVLENVDPDGLSRIKVQFPWQAATNQSTPWIRVMTPHSGGNKGFHFIPEVGEEVIVGFEGGNAERPYVMGALYTGKNKPESWQTDANNIKAIRTRSGHTIELNDTKGEEKINIYDNEGSIITFDTQAKSLTINATEELNLVAKNINIQAEENINIGSEQNVEIAAESKLSVLSNDSLKLQSSGDSSVKSNGAFAIEATSDATIKGANAIIEGKAGAEVNGATAKLNGKTLTEVAGKIVKLN